MSFKINQNFAGRAFYVFALFLSLILMLHSELNAMEISSKPVLPPVAICKNISVQLGTTGTVTITAADVDGGSFDPDGTITNRTVIPSTFNCSQKGSNNVTLTVTDNEGLTASCTATVIVEDKNPPVMVCTNFTLYLDASGRGTLTTADINNGSSDNCASPITLSLSRTQFDCSDIASPVSVTLTGTDDSGNSSSCTSTVTVKDTIAPVVNVKSYDLVLNASGTGTLLPANVDNGSFDNCGPVTLTVSPDTFSCNDLGDKTVNLTAVDSHGNSSTKSVVISVSSTLNIAGMSLSSCDLAPVLALFQADIEGGTGNYNYLWRGLEPASKPFMIIIPTPPSLQFFNTSVLQSPFFNNTMPNGIYNIRLTVTDGNGCKDSSQIRINKTGVAFNNKTVRYSEACEGEILTYSVNYKSDATYAWSVTNGTILSADQDTSRIQVQWNLGVTTGTVVANLQEPNGSFPGGQCGSEITDSVTIIPVPSPVFNNPAISVCSGSISTYTLTNSYNFNTWNVTGGVITAGGKLTDNFVTVRWGTGPSGTITISAGNNPLCEGSANLNISIFNLTGRITSITNVKCNGGSDGSVTVAADEGTGVPPYMYSVDVTSWQAGGTFTGLAIGNHTAHIRDALLCTFDIPFIITQPAKVSGMVSSQTNVSCFWGSNGSATILASGGTTPYQYSLNGGVFQNQNIFSGLAAGPYTVIIKDINGCTGTVVFTITEPAAALSGSSNVTNVTCFGASTGAINITVSGGTPLYAYLWNNGATTEDLNNIPAGNYSVVITDSHGCTATVAAVVTQPATGLSGSTTVTNVLCFGALTGAIDLTVTGGTPGYSYLWSNGAVTEDLANIAAGVYSVTTTDANGCKTNSSATVTQPAASLGGSATSQTDVSCKGGNDGSVTVSGTGGTAPYQYRLGAGLFQASDTFTNLATGIYSVTVRDSNLCTFSFNVTITEPAQALSGSITSQTNVLCFGGSTGGVTVSGSGGTPPYSYNIDGGSFQASGTFGGLSPGNHPVIIRDKNLCTFNLNVNITQPVSAVDVSIISQTNVKCFGTATGSVTVAGSGGTPPYTYSKDGGLYQASDTFINMTAGTHTISVRDNNLCLKNIPATITQPAAPLAVTSSETDALCFGGSSGTATAVPSGGTPPYTYSWNTVPVQTSATATGLAAGTYSVQITDANSCTANGSVTVNQPQPLNGNIAVSNVACFGSNTGSCNLTVSGGVTPYTFLWNNGLTTEDITGLASGNYSVTITDKNLCSTVVSATISQPASALTGTITSQTDVSVYGGSDGSVTVAGSGGTGPYEYKLGSGSFQPSGTFNSLSAGAYIVTVRDAALCTFNVNVDIAQPFIPLTIRVDSLINVLCSGGSTGIISVSGWGGTSPYHYSINGGPMQPSGFFGSLAAGNYSIHITDTDSGVFDTIFIITEPSPVIVTVTSTNNLCRGGSDGSATATVTGGVTPYRYSWNTLPQQTTPTATGLRAGLYSVFVKDTNGCVVSNSVVISQPDSELKITITKIDVKCPGGSDGTALAVLSNGTPPFSFEWTTLPVQTNASVAGLSAGSYSVTVTDSLGCIKTESVDITAPAAMTIDSTVVAASCPESSDGSITLSVSGGSQPYTFLWSDGESAENRTGLAPGNYTVIITDNDLCTKSASLTVGSTGSFGCVIIPDIITPNNDGFNDEWRIKNIELYPDAEISVYNRWGKLVFRTKNISANPWNGTIDGKLVPTDSYHYILRLNDGSKPITGVISVIR